MNLKHLKLWHSSIPYCSGLEWPVQIPKSHHLRQSGNKQTKPSLPKTQTHPPTICSRSHNPIKEFPCTINKPGFPMFLTFPFTHGIFTNCLLMSFSLAPWEGYASCKRRLPESRPLPLERTVDHQNTLSCPSGGFTLLDPK